MVMNISNALSAYKQADNVGMGGASSSATPVGGEKFSDMLEGFLGDTVESVRNSESMATKGAVGKADLQEVILAVSDAEVMMKTLTSIRDKLISAYQEVIRTAI